MGGGGGGGGLYMVEVSRISTPRVREEGRTLRQSSRYQKEAADEDDAKDDEQDGAKTG